MGSGSAGEATLRAWGTEAQPRGGQEFFTRAIQRLEAEGGGQWGGGIHTHLTLEVFLPLMSSAFLNLLFYLQSFIVSSPQSEYKGQRHIENTGEWPIPVFVTWHLLSLVIAAPKVAPRPLPPRAMCLHGTLPHG